MEKEKWKEMMKRLGKELHKPMFKVCYDGLTGDESIQINSALYHDGYARTEYDPETRTSTWEYGGNWKFGEVNKKPKPLKAVEYDDVFILNK